MLDEPGVYVVTSADAMRIVDECRKIGWRVIYLPAGIASKDQFFDAVRDKCSLDPPLHSNRSWDALSDSLWSGLDEENGEGIVILWPNADYMKSTEPEDFDIATNILDDLCVSLSDSNTTASKTKKLIVLQSQS